MGNMPTNKQLSKKGKEKRTHPSTAKAWDYSEAKHLCTLTFYKNSNGACVADLHAGKKRLFSVTHPAAILSAMYLTNSAVLITTKLGQEKFDPAWNLDSFVAAHAMMKIGLLTCPYLSLATTVEEKKWLEGFWVFSHDNFEKPSSMLDEYVRSTQFFFIYNGNEALLERRLESPDPAGWKKTLKQRCEFTYFPDL